MKKVVVLAMMVLGIIALPTAAYADPHDPNACYNTSCDGRRPELSTGCLTGAITLLGSRTYVTSGVYIELIYGPNCGAVWAHTNNQLSSVTIYAKSVYISSWTERARAYAITQGGGAEYRRYSGMVGAMGYATAACYVVNSNTGAAICTPYAEL